MERYDRQIRLPGFGTEAQMLLHTSHVLIIGAGGLGCPVLQYLVAAGVGHIGIVDDDIVSLSNLHRQVLYDEADIGQKKVFVAAEKLSRQNSSIRLDKHNERLSSSNVRSILEPYDYIVDCSDNFPTRYLLNDACILMEKTLVYGAVNRYEGQVTVFNAPSYGSRSAGYRDLFPKPPADGEVADCTEGGVLGVLPGIIGSLQAMEVIKLITAIGEPLIEKLLTYSLLTHQFILTSYCRDKNSSRYMPGSLDALAGFDYGEICTLPFGGMVIDAIAFDEMIGRADVCFIDCRETNEVPAVSEFSHLHMPFSSFSIGKYDFSLNEYVIFCQSGKRSKSFADKLSVVYGATKRFYTLENGIVSWKAYKEGLKNPLHEN